MHWKRPIQARIRLVYFFDGPEDLNNKSLHADMIKYKKTKG